MKNSLKLFTHHLAITLIAISVFFQALPEAFAASLRVSPVRVDLTPQRTRSSVTVYNEGDAAFSVEARALTWAQQDGEDILEPTTDLIVVPPIFELEPGTEQIVRIGLRGQPGTTKELTYRLFVTQLPPEGGFTGLGSAIRFSIPVFVTPMGAVAVPEWTVDLVEPRQLKVRIENAGSAHMRIGEMKVLSAVDREVVLSGAEGGSFLYILPGSSQEWVIPLVQDLPDEGYVVQAETRDGVLEQIFPSP